MNLATFNHNTADNVPIAIYGNITSTAIPAINILINKGVIGTINNYELTTIVDML